MGRITALERLPRGRFRVDVDGRQWRILPAEVVLAAGLVEGVELDRPTLRLLRKELRHVEAIDAAARALRHRDLSVARLRERLEAVRLPPASRAGAVASLARAGLLDDRRLALRRAEKLAERGAGDDEIRFRLEGERIASDLIDDAIAELPPERERAAAVVARRGNSLATARYLARRGFDPESIADVVAAGIAPTP